MTFDDWRPAVDALRARVQAATEGQRALAEQLGISLPRNMPAAVAAEKLKDALRDVLWLPPDREPSFGQAEYLHDLARDLDKRPPPGVATHSIASAWIYVLNLQRAINALERLELRRGDLARVHSGPDPGVEEVKSIGHDGTVYFVGGGGRRADPHRISLAARSGTVEATEFAKEAANRRAHRKVVPGPPSAERLALLEPFRITQDAPLADPRLLQDTVDKAADERPLQKFLSQYPSVLASLVTSSAYGLFVMPLPRLGSEYIPDFALAVADSMGMHWTVVELESPRVEPSTQDGQPGEKLRHAIGQINDWRDWLSDNLAYARQPVTSNGLGLLDIDPMPRGLVLIGRANDRHARFNQRRRRISDAEQIEIHTYDWLIRVVETQHPLQSPLEYDRDHF